MRIAAPILAGSLLLATVLAQDPVDQKPAKERAAARLQELQDLQQQAVAEWRKSIEAARAAASEAKPGTVLPAMSMRPDLGPVVAKAKQFAAEFADGDDAVPFLNFVVRNSADKATSREAIDTLIAKHLDSAKLGQIGSVIPSIAQLVDAKYAEYAIARLLNSADANVRGWALFARHQQDIENGDRASEQYALARKELMQAMASATDERLAGEIRTAIDLREKFALGLTAPDIEGVDLDGVAFKLSDYQGKVVFLDFWGDW